MNNNKIFKVILVGKTNTGKSFLFNQIIKKQLSLESNSPYTTRDLIQFQINNINYVDSGDFFPWSYQENNNSMKLLNYFNIISNKILLEINKSNLILLVFNNKIGFTIWDLHIAKYIYKCKENKKIIIINNESDINSLNLLKHNLKSEGLNQLYDDIICINFRDKKGIKNLIELINNYKKENLIENVIENLPNYNNNIKISFVGKPNVGKSSIVNSILKENRIITNDMHGTTNQVISTDYKFDYNNNIQNITILDTPGITKSLINNKNFYIYMYNNVFNFSNVIVLVLDYIDYINKQDKKIIDEILYLGKPLIILINKFDLASLKEQQDKKYKQYIIENINKNLFFASKAKVFFTTTKKDYDFNLILNACLKINIKNNTQFSTDIINTTFNNIINKSNFPKFIKEIFKNSNLIQDKEKNLTFKIFCNIPKNFKLQTNYKKYLESQFIEKLKLYGCRVNYIFLKK